MALAINPDGVSCRSPHDRAGPERVQHQQDGDYSESIDCGVHEVHECAGTTSCEEQGIDRHVQTVGTLNRH
jgi:hypothetical protein